MTTNWLSKNPMRDPEQEGLDLLSRAQKEAHAAEAALDRTIEALEDAAEIRGFAADARPAAKKIESARKKLIEAMQETGFW